MAMDMVHDALYCGTQDRGYRMVNGEYFLYIITAVHRDCDETLVLGAIPGS